MKSRFPCQRSVLVRSSIRFNHRHKEFGHVFSGRYKSLIVDGSGSGYLEYEVQASLRPSLAAVGSAAFVALTLLCLINAATAESVEDKARLSLQARSFTTEAYRKGALEVLLSTVNRAAKDLRL